MQRLLTQVVLTVLIVGCGKTQKEPSPVPSHNPVPQVGKDLRLGTPLTTTIDGKRVLTTEIAKVIHSQKTQKQWQLYFPDNIPLDDAILLFEELKKAGAADISVHSETKNHDWEKRDVGVRIVSDSSVLVLANMQKPPVRRKCSLAELPASLKPVLARFSTSHVRLVPQSPEPSPLKPYIEVLMKLKASGVRTISFYGVYYI